MIEQRYERTKEQEACTHHWVESNYVIDTLPETYTRRCSLCGLVQHSGGIKSVGGKGGWYDAGCCMKQRGAEKGANSQ